MLNCFAAWIMLACEVATRYSAAVISSGWYCLYVLRRMVFTWALPNPEGVGRPMPGGHRVRSEFWIGYLCILLKLIFCYFKKNHKNFYNNTFLGILQVKLAGTTEEPYFCGKDVCEMLGYEIVEPENKKELKYLGPNDPQKVVSNLDTTFLGINRPLTFNEGKAIYINEFGLRSLISGSRTHKNKTLFLNQVDKWLLDTCSGLVDFFSFIKGYNLAFDLESGWFQDLWYPLTKKQFLNSNHEKDTRYGANFGPNPNHSQPPQMGGLTMVRNRPPIASKPIHEKDTRYGASFGPKPNHFGPPQMGGPEVIRNHPFIITRFEDRDISDKQERFARMLTILSLSSTLVCKEKFRPYPKIIDKKRWICMDPKDFKKTVLRLNTWTGGV